MDNFKIFLVFLLVLFCSSVDCVVARKSGKTHKAGLRREATCGYASCDLGKPDLLNVHIVAHTHDDVGWLKTVDQYYYGARNDIQYAGVQYILDSVVAALNLHPARKFIYVETAFFWRWWQEQSETLQKNVQNLVNEGRLTFINGAWSMNDEATTHYSSIIENFAWGLRRLNDSFGSCGRPTVGWQIDPFGHSRDHATILSQLGFDGLFLGRIDFQDKSNREAKRAMEMIWESSPNLGNSADLFTGILPNGYSPPSKFCFDMLCQDTPIMDDHRLGGYNVDQLVQLFITEMNNQANVYASSNLIVTMGEDFNYQNAEMWFKNLDKLMTYVNAQQSNGSKVNLIYSTPACYLYALNQANLKWPVKSDDFFPYGSGAHTYWTGYFTSRPAIKRFERETSAFLNFCKQISAMAALEGQTDKITLLREAIGVAQHHDAVSGTEKQEVAFDYALQLDEGVKACQDVVKKGLTKLVPISPNLEIKYCDLLNISQCEVTEENKDVTLLLWNPIGRQVEQYVHIPVPDGDSYVVMDGKGVQIAFQINPLYRNVLDIPGRSSTSTQELVFYVTLPPVGYAAYTIQRNNGQSSDKAATVVTRTNLDFDSDVVFQNQFFTLIFDQPTGLMKTITNMETQDVAVLDQTFNYYAGVAGDNSAENMRASGAYIFRPNCTVTPASKRATDCLVPALGDGTYVVVQGSLVQEIRQHFAPWISQITRVYANSPFVEFEWQVGPIPVSDGIGKEVVSVFRSDLNSNQTFYTDSNGREMLKRTRNFQPTYKNNLTEPISSNYYPVNSRIFLQDQAKGTQLTILTDRTQGGSSLYDGRLELMLHRRLLWDDGLGVGEALNEVSYGKGLVVRGKHYLLFTKTTEAAKAHRLLAQELYWHPEAAFITNSQSDRMKKPLKPSRSPILLPSNVHLLSLEQWTNTSLVLRVEHIFEEGEDALLSLPATVDLQEILGDVKIKSVQEMTLDANVPITAINRLKWTKSSKHQPSIKNEHHVDYNSYNVTLNCMQIRTFQIEISA